MRRFVGVAALIVAWLFVNAASAEAQQGISPPSSVGRQSLDDAWWTGPMLAPSAATLPRGHFLIEPYLYDVIATHSNGFGSLTYLNYGLVDRVTVGLIPTAGFNRVSNGPSSSVVRPGEVSLQAQYRLTKFHAGSWIPTTSLAVQETLPTGKYDRLGNRPSDGLGSGAYATTLALYSQMYFWLPNGRILRMRFNVSQGFSKNVNVEDVSVYGTGAGFRGHAKPGSPFFADAAWEYSLTRSWVLALDVTYRHDGNTSVTGYNVLDPSSVQNPPSIRLNTGSSDAFGFAPAIEYNWKPNLGVLLGTRVIPAGHNTHATITPAVAINFVH
jgi:Putative MetA-pathway of phenol degradation